MKTGFPDNYWLIPHLQVAFLYFNSHLLLILLVLTKKSDWQPDGFEYCFLWREA
jgi:hypothetical protein